MERRSYDDYLATRAARRAAVGRVIEFLGEPRRDRPRDPEKAAALRRAGCSERMIGPMAARELVSA